MVKKATREVYEASDGSIFDTEEEAQRYEAKKSPHLALVGKTAEELTQAVAYAKGHESLADAIIVAGQRASEARRKSGITKRASRKHVAEVQTEQPGTSPATNDDARAKPVRSATK